jgi:hypothetical protein
MNKNYFKKLQKIIFQILVSVKLRTLFLRKKDIFKLVV